MADYYVDTDKADNAGDGLSWSTAKKNLSNAVALVTGTLAAPVTIHCRGSAADTVAVTVSGFTPSATNYLTIQCDDGDGHAGVWDTGKYRLHIKTASDYSGCTALYSTAQYTRFVGLQVMADSDGRHGDLLVAFSLKTENVTTGGMLDRCLAYTVPTSGKDYNLIASLILVDSGGGVTTRNSVLWTAVNGFSVEHGFRFNGTNQAMVFQNCDFINHTAGITSQYGGNVTLTNCLFSGCTTDVEPGTSTITDTYCATTNDNTKGLTPAGTGNRFSQTFSFVNAAGGNYQLSPSDAGAKGYGSDLSGTFTTDIAGTTRTSPWDIGAWKAQSVASFLNYVIVRG